MKSFKSLVNDDNVKGKGAGYKTNENIILAVKLYIENIKWNL